MIDAALGTARILLERSLAGRPPGEAVPPDDPYNSFEQFYGYLLAKRGAIRVAHRLPALYPRNAPFVFSRHIVFFALGVLAALTAVYVRLPAGGIAPSLVAVLPFVVGKHLSILAGWHATGVYDRASAVTVRPRELLYTVLVGLAAVLVAFAWPRGSEQVAAATALALVPKLAFDFREAGIGPCPLTFDPRAGATEEPVEVPAGTPDRVFGTDDRAVDREALAFGLVYAIYPGLLVTGPWGVAAVVSFDSLRITPATTALWVALTLVVTLSVTFPWMRLGCANVEYRVYEGSLVAYDAFLEEPQWVLSDNVRAVSVDGDVRIRGYDGTERRIEFLERPNEFARSVRRALVETA
ncbi:MULTISPECIES: phosphomannomutase [Halorubrum]|uniref:phosphomannomutase n=1 Tax=Halorubrum TaxID=56688 RepID=UPI0012671639|nr:MULTISPECIES: phosphomannomutase [Halorubrum]